MGNIDKSKQRICNFLESLETSWGISNREHGDKRKYADQLQCFPICNLPLILSFKLTFSTESRGTCSSVWVGEVGSPLELSPCLMPAASKRPGFWRTVS